MIIDDLAKIEQSCKERDIPCLGADRGAWLAAKITQLKPQRVLELGMAIGYSGIILAHEGAKLTCIELSKPNVEEARNNFLAFGVKAIIISGNATDQIKKLEPGFDLVFVDFRKEIYQEVFEDCVQLTKSGGVIIFDDINLEKCKAFKAQLQKDDRLTTEIVDIHHGLSCSVKL
jgi:predicted O-methyltransferase YrrM